MSQSTLLTIVSIGVIINSIHCLLLGAMIRNNSRRMRKW